MTDLVMRLRILSTYWEKPGELIPSKPMPNIHDVTKEAADRIEVLEAALRKIADLIDSEAGEPLDDAIAIASAALDKEAGK